MTTKELIRTATEGQKQLMDFINSLPKEPVEPEVECNDLEEAADHYAKNYTVEDYYKDTGINQTYVIANDAFIAGSKWQYQKDRGKFAQIKAKTWCEGFDACKEQMMKDAIDIKVIESYNPTCEPNERLHGISFIYDCKNDNQYLIAEDRAKIIIVKKD